MRVLLDLKIPRRDGVGLYATLSRPDEGELEPYILPIIPR